MKTTRKSSALSMLLLLATAQIVGCGGTKDELNRAQQDIDTRQYQQAIERLERLADKDPDIITSDNYLDLLSSAYLGQSGVDLIDVFGHWAKIYNNQQGKEEKSPISFDQYKEIIQSLSPPNLYADGMPYLQKALKLCNNRLNISKTPTPLGRILIKTVFVNFWALVDKLGNTLIPAAEKLINGKSAPVICAGFLQITISSKHLLEFTQNIALAALLLGDHDDPKIKNIRNLSKLTTSLNWIEQYTSCEQLTNDEIEKIKQFFTHI